MQMDYNDWFTNPGAMPMQNNLCLHIIMFFLIKGTQKCVS